MRYDVTLRIDYEYSVPADHTRNLLKVCPRDIAGLQSISRPWLTFEPQPDENRAYADFFGNNVTSAVWRAPLQGVGIALEFRAERYDPDPPALAPTALDLLGDEIRRVTDISPQSPHHYLAPSRRVPPSEAMASFARACLKPGMAASEAVRAVGIALHDEMEFVAGVTDVDTPSQTAFANRAGVCQDFSHIMIGCLRGIGVPAGYVSGFLRTRPPPGQPRLAGVDAMHAWVRAWCGRGIGWMEYDPTNRQAAGRDYIAIGYGRDYDDIAPVRGSVRAAGAQSSRQSVDVVPLEED